MNVRSRWSISRARTGAVLAAAALVGVGATACDPPPAPDGRDLGVAIDATPATVEKGTPLQVTGTLTNHGSVAADGVRLGYGATAGFTVQSAAVDGSGTGCVVQAALNVECELAAPLGPGQSVPFTVALVAGSVSGATTHLVAVSSSGTEPVGDANPNLASFDVGVVNAPAPPAPLAVGGGRNHLGTRTLLGGAGLGLANEQFTLAVSPYCTDKVNGDRYQAGFAGGPCTGTANSEYDPGGYAYTIDVPAGRPSALRVLLWDPAYTTANAPGGEGPIDSVLNHGGPEDFSFRLLAADATPDDFTDNPVLCAATYSATTPFDLSFLGSERWNQLPCTLPVSAPAGRYVVQVANQGAVTDPLASGTNNFAIVAAYESDGLDPAAVLCGRVDDPACPVVAGAGRASIYAEASGTVADLVLGEVEAVHEGRRLEIELFDPGEGAQSIRILMPTAEGTWAPATFHWESPEVGSGTGTSLVVANGQFNGRTVTLAVDLTGYQPGGGSAPWKLRYQYGAGVTTDRLTIDATIVDPVT